MSPEELAFWNAIKANPDDRATRLVFADWCDEHERPDLAFAMRWSGARGRFPIVTRSNRYAGWATVPHGQRRPAQPHQLPRLVFERLRGGARFSTHRRYADVCRAFCELAAALSAIRDVIDPEGRGVK